jgi:hypothetical protein
MTEVVNFEIGPENEVQLLKQFKSFQIKYLAVYLTVMGKYKNKENVFFFFFFLVVGVFFFNFVVSG